MTRIKQFANDMGLSYNQAKGLVEKGRKKKDGGSTVLEKFMPIEIVPKRKTDRSRAKERMKEKNEQPKKEKEPFEGRLPIKAKKEKEPFEGRLPIKAKNGGTNVKTMPKKHKLEKYLTKQEIKKIGPMGAELLLKVQEGIMKGRGKKNGGVLKPIPPDAKGLQALKKERPDVVASMGFKKKGGTMKMMSGGGVARGTGAAVKGTGFKGVY